MRISMITLSTGLVLASTLSLIGPPPTASASSQPGLVQIGGRAPGDAVATKLGELDEAQSKRKPLSREETERLGATWVASDFAGAPGDSVDPAAATGWDIGAGKRLLQVPFSASAGLLRESNVSIIFNESGRMIGSSAMELRTLDAQSGTLRVWTNGQLTLSRTVSDADQPNSARSTWWGRFNTCLANAGIASWVVTAISLACTAACAVTLGAGCLACAAAASGVAGGTIGYCIGSANRG
ncbi:hypothetical protein [Curtobacterium sp. Leaf261]|uniref:hypothetical protein n=1 Tax=Curtobacterium sp. Leaf261 TaxID=1736311 RepID=UPI000B1437F9|nr:hypothetical protein [Curtobacterium sp. Leaf261]